VVREETLLFLPNATFLVADACSGFATLYAAVGVAVVLAAYARSWRRRLLLLASAWPLALACNVARVTLLVGLANHFGLGLLDTPFHAASGVATFWAVLLLQILMADRRALRGTYA
jgi:exosortase